jgi:hypothetical protein
MNEELRKAIRALSEAAFQTGRWRLSPIAPTDADINAAEAAVVAIFERDRAVAKQLAEALRELSPCRDCEVFEHEKASYCHKEKVNWKCGRIDYDAALAAYEALEAGK